MFINKEHKDITSNSKGKMTITFREDKVFFSKATCLAAKMEPNKYIHFIENTWAFICNNNSKGFRITKDGSRHGYVINNVSLIRKFIQDRKRTVPCSFYVQTGTKELEGVPLMEILLNKSVKELLSQQAKPFRNRKFK